MDIYNQLQQKLHTHPAGAPDRPEFMEILRILFTPEEAEFALNLSFRPKPIDAIAQKTGLPAEEVIAMGERLANKGIIISGTRHGNNYYGLLPTAPGMFENPLRRGWYSKDIDIDYDRLGHLWEEYYGNGHGNELHGSKTNPTRVLPVRKAIPAATRVLPFEEVSHYIGKAEYISLGPCACRLASRNCDNPIDVCISFDDAAKFLVERNMGRFISQEEALKVLEECEDAGLVHITMNSVDRNTLICNCCPCCCNMIGALTRIKDAVSYPVSNFYSSINTDDCTACGLCEDRCPAKAISIDDVAVVDLSLCIGCGLCASACPTDAITLIRRDDSVDPPADIKELYLTIAEEKGRLEDFLGNLA